MITQYELERYRDLEFLSLGFNLDNPKTLGTDNYYILSQIPAVYSESYDTLLKEMDDLWMSTVEKVFKLGELVVPLSGGVDSRLLLSSVLKLTEASNIDTFTFGIKNALDFKIGNHIARKINSNHFQYDLNAHEYSIYEEIEYLKNVNGRTLAFLHPPFTDISNRYFDKHILSGTGIDVFFGRHLINGVHQEASLESYFDGSLYNKVHGFKINFSQFNELRNLPQLNLVLDVEVRQSRFVIPHICTTNLNWHTMLTNELIKFSCSLPVQYKIRQRFYYDYARKYHAELFKLNVKSNFLYNLKYDFPGSYHIRKLDMVMSNLFSSKRYLNYVDWEAKYIIDKGFRHLLLTCIEDLKSRKRDYLKSQIEVALFALKNGLKGHWSLIHALASLELNLKAGE